MIFVKNGCMLLLGTKLFGMFSPVKYMMGNPLLIVVFCMGKSIRIQRVNKPFLCHVSIRMKKMVTEKSILQTQSI